MKRKRDNAEQTLSIYDAAKLGDLKTVKQVIALKPDLAKQTDDNGYTPLIYAAIYGKSNVVEYLAPLSDVEAVDAGGNSALMVAALNGHLDIVKYLKEVIKADANKVNPYEKTALMLAVWQGHKNVVEYLVKNCAADITKECQTGHNALTLAMVWKHWEITNYLLDAVPDSEDGSSPIKNERYKEALSALTADEARKLAPHCTLALSHCDGLNKANFKKSDSIPGATGNSQEVFLEAVYGEVTTSNYLDRLRGNRSGIEGKGREM